MRRPVITGSRARQLGVSTMGTVISIALLAAISMMLIGTVMRNNATAQDTEAFDAATLYANGIIERTKAMPWSDLGFTPAQGAPETDPEGNPTVIIESSTYGGTDQWHPRPLEEGIVLDGVKGSRFDVETFIAWRHRPGLNPDGDDTSGFGTKRVTVRVSWGDGQHSITVPGDRTPTIGEAVPSDIENTGDVIEYAEKPTLVLSSVPDMRLTGWYTKGHRHHLELLRGSPGAEPAEGAWSGAERLAPSGGRLANCGEVVHGEVKQSHTTHCEYDRIDEGGWFRIVVQTVDGQRESDPVYVNPLMHFVAPELSATGEWNYSQLSWTSVTAGVDGGGYWPSDGRFTVQHSRSAEGPWTDIGEEPYNTHQHRHDTDNLDEFEGDNYYRVQATLGTRTLTSNVVHVYTIHRPLPVDLDLTLNTSTNVATATWSEMQDADSYVVQWRLGTSGSWSSVTASATNRQWTRNMVNGQILQVRVAGRNDAGQAGWSNIAQIETRLDPPSLSVGNITQTSARFSWTAATGATRYEYRYRNHTGSWSSWSSATSTGTTRNVTRSTTAGGRIQVQVRAVNSAGASDWSSTVTANLLAPTASPSITRTSSGNYSANYSWTSVTGATRYEYQVRINGGSWGSAVNNGTGRTLRVDRGSRHGDRVEVRARAANLAGSGPWSSINNVRLSVRAPSGSLIGQGRSDPPLLQARVREVSCPAGTEVHRRWQRRWVGDEWPGFGGYAYGGATTSGWVGSSTGRYDLALDVSLRVRCTNPSSGAYGDETGSIIVRNIRHQVPTPSGFWLEVGDSPGGQYHQIAAWGASCPSSLEVRYAYDIRSERHGRATSSSTSATRFTAWRGDPWHGYWARVEAWCRHPNNHSVQSSKISREFKYAWD